MDKKKLKETALGGLFSSNPVFCLVLGTCPTLAMSKTLEQAIAMGLATTFVLLCSNVIISLLRNVIPQKIRIPCYIIIISTFVIMVEMIMKKYIPGLYSVMKVFISLIVVNCIILARAESFASMNNALFSAVDGLSMGLGFTLSISLLAFIRELVTGGTIWGIPIFGENFPVMGGVSSSAMGFILFGLLMALFNFIRQKKTAKGGK